MINKIQLVNKIDKLSLIEQKEIFKIIETFNINYTKNKNGIFINLSNINSIEGDICLNEINNYINYLEQNKKKINNIENICNNISHKQKIDDENNYKLYHFSEDHINSFLTNLTDYKEIHNHFNIKSNKKLEKYNNYLNIIKKYNRLISIKYLNLYENNKNLENNLTFNKFLIN